MRCSNNLAEISMGIREACIRDGAALRELEGVTLSTASFRASASWRPHQTVVG